MSAQDKGAVTACGLVPFPHLHVAMRGLACMLAMRMVQPPSPFDEEREEAIEAIRTALLHPVSADTATALNSHASLQAQVEKLEVALFKAEALLDSIWELEVPPNKLIEVIELWRQDRAALSASRGGK